MPVFRAIVAASQAADAFQTGLSLSKTLKQPPLVKPTEKWENEASAAPAKSKRSKLELATGITAIGTAVVPLVAGVVNLFTRNKSYFEASKLGENMLLTEFDVMSKMKF